MRWWWTCRGSGSDQCLPDGPVRRSAACWRSGWRRRCVLWAGLLALTLLAACAPADPGQALLQDYIDRVARVVDGDAVDLDDVRLQGWPRRRHRVLEVPPQRTGLGRFLSLHRCDLGPLIGERSSQLGRVMTASQRLSYEHRFLLAAQQCLDRLEGDERRAALREALAEVVAEKREYLPELAWNATMGHDTLAAVHALDVAALPPGEAADRGQVATASLQQLAERVPLLGTPALSLHDWNEPWEVLQGSPFGGEARRSLVLLTRALDQAATLLERRQAERPLCPQGLPTPRAETLNNVFTRYYAAEVQPWLANVHRGYGRWLQALEGLLAAQLVAPPEVMARYHEDVLRAEWDAYISARDRHTEVWQEVLQGCDLAPRPPGRS